MGKFRFRGRRNATKHEGASSVPLKSLIPNLITSIAACAGITSISLSSEGRFTSALVALLIACVCDGMDGRVARLLNASSKLGAELDSLADFVNFGVAPAMFMYFWLTGGPNHIGCPTVMVRAVLACSLFYAMCDCFRLARFNTMLEQEPLPYWKHFFTGVPAPGGCWMVLTPYILLHSLKVQERWPKVYDFVSHPYFGMAMLLFIGVLMASRIPTISLKAIRVKKSSQMPVIALGLFIIGCLFFNLWLTLGIIGAIYILTVPLAALMFLKAKSNYESNKSVKE
ncbi:MAG: phosphatidylcholine/phosphatidylserine synthase [Kiritimatiellae bacterium]|nr:phosphatidylcholine/phosphatidylserine synthase [Kiritimatiellia bacterium]